MGKTTKRITIPARYNGFCRQCRQTYAAGSPITKVAHRTWVHEACATDNPLPTTTDPVEPPAVLPLANDGPKDAELIRVEKIAEIVHKELEGATLSVDEDEVRPVVRDELQKAGIVKHVIEVKSLSGDAFQIEGKAHAKLARAVRLATARKNILLIGPAGCGKTHLAEQVAAALGLRFAFISCSAGMSEGQLLGRLVPTGDAGKFEYLRSEFVRCYEEGGVFLFDELDAADSNTLLILNAALANGHLAVPNRPEKPVAKKHPDFLCIAAANTFGTGADRQYVGRNQLDESTLDRFRVGQIEMDYDADIEVALCPDEALRNRLVGYRKRARDARVRRIVSMRFIRDAFDMKQVGDTDQEIDDALFAGWTREEIAKVKSESTTHVMAS
jgi:MoxR-like ATPase